MLGELVPLWEALLGKLLQQLRAHQQLLPTRYGVGETYRPYNVLCLARLSQADWDEAIMMCCIWLEAVCQYTTACFDLGVPCGFAVVSLRRFVSGFI